MSKSLVSRFNGTLVDKQKEYGKRLSKLDAILSDVEDLKKNLVSEVSEFFDMTKPWATFRCSGT